MRLLLLLALVACGGKDAKVPAIDTIDRTCKVDADCTLAVDVCCTGCGGHVGEPVNRLAWKKTAGARAARCAKQTCPDVNCAEVPDCHDEHAAICKAGICERETKPTAACADLACETADDCTRYTFRGCCETCGGSALNKAAAARRRDADAAGCAAKTVSCPILDCKMLASDCVNKQCVAR